MSIDEFTQSTSTSASPIIETRDLNVIFDMDRGRANVLKDISLDIYEGEILGIVGESGSGKSMFASALLDAVDDPGLLTGSLRYHRETGDTVDIVDLGKKDLKRLRWEEVAMVFQGAMDSFNPTMRIGDHFNETVRAHDADMSERMEHANSVMEQLNLDVDRVMDSYPHELSGGMKQRALIALALLLEPRVLVMDEPTGALDLLMQRSIISLLLDLQQEFDLTIVFITHDLSLISGLADRVAVMYGFEFVEVGPTEEVLREAAHPYTRSLLRSVPSLGSSLEEMRAIEGDSPDPVNMPQGCTYAPRCPLADERCRVEDPDLRGTDDEDHEVACFYWEQSEDAISYSLDSDFWGGR